MKSRLGVVLVGVSLLAACASSSSSSPSDEGVAQGAAFEKDEDPICGTRTGIQCPPGLICAENPDDECDPKNGDQDCPGRCVMPPPPQQDEDQALCTTTGLWGQECPKGYECQGEPNCNDCPGVCVRKPAQVGEACNYEITCVKGAHCVLPEVEGCGEPGSKCVGKCVSD